MPVIILSTIIFFGLIFFLIRQINLNLKPILRKILAFTWVVFSVLSNVFFIRIKLPIIFIIGNIIFSILVFVNKFKSKLVHTESKDVPVYKKYGDNIDSENVADITTVMDKMTCEEALDILNLVNYSLNNLTEGIIDKAFEDLVNKISNNGRISTYILNKSLAAKNILLIAIKNGFKS